MAAHDSHNCSRTVFASLRTMHGSYIPFAKLQAIIIGDRSGAFIHPFFVHFAELSGCHFYQYDRSDYSLLQYQAELLRATYDSLDTMRPEDDPLAFAQAQIYMSMGVMNTGNIKIAMNHLRKGADTIQSFNITFVPQTAGGSENFVQEIGGYSEEAHERAAFLSKILHFEAYLSFYVMGLPGIQCFDADRDRSKVSVKRLIYCQLFGYLSDPSQHITAQKVQDSITELCDDLEHQFKNELPVGSLSDLTPLVL